MSHGRVWRGLVLLLVVTLHLWLGWSLWTTRQPRSPAPETLLVLTFETRVDFAPTLVAPPGRAPAEESAEPRGLRPGSARAAGPDSAALEQTPARAPLQLSLAPGSARPDTYRRDILHTPRVLEHRATRFDDAWISNGTLVEVVARRSMVAGVLLSAMGALTKPCTERQRSNYDAACVPDRYVHVDEDEL